MTYERHRLGRQRVKYNNANDDRLLKYQLLVDSAKVTPTSATIAIYKPGSSTAVQSATAMTKSGTLLTYALDTSSSTSDYAKNTGYRAEIIVTYDSKTYERHFMFDIVAYPFESALAYDQLVAYDDNVRDMQHDGDEDFSELIGAMEDVHQANIESKVMDAERVQMSWVIDASQVDVAFRDLVLFKIYENRREFELADRYWKRYEDKMEAVLSVTPYDDDQNGEESSDLGTLDDLVLEL